MPLAFFFVACLSAGSALAWHPFDDVQARENNEISETPPVEQAVNIAGFKLVVDRTQLGYDIYPKEKDGLLGTLSGDEYDVNIRRLPSNIPIEELAKQLARKMSGDPNSEVKISSTHALKGVKGMEVVCEDKAGLFSSHVRRISYLYVNRSGETICFSGLAKTSNPDWDYFKYLMTEGLEPGAA